jgi:hypothetical protein
VFFSRVCATPASGGNNGFLGRFLTLSALEFEGARNLHALRVEKTHAFARQVHALGVKTEKK